MTSSARRTLAETAVIAVTASIAPLGSGVALTWTAFAAAMAKVDPATALALLPSLFTARSA